MGGEDEDFEMLDQIVKKKKEKYVSFLLVVCGSSLTRM